MMTTTLTPTHLAVLRICALRPSEQRHDETERLSFGAFLDAVAGLDEIGLVDTDLMATEAGRAALAQHPDIPVELCSGPPGYLPARARERELRRGEAET